MSDEKKSAGVYGAPPSLNPVDSRLNKESLHIPSNVSITSLSPDHLASISPAEQLKRLSKEEYDELERKTVRKMDFRMIPWLCLLFTMSFLDRVNVGVAKLAGLTTDLNLTTNKFNNISVIFFVSYVAFEIPSNLILKKMRPSRWIPTIMILWAAVQISMGFVKNYGQLLALRFLLGLFECGLFPGIAFFLTGWYKRSEISKRISLFFAGAVLAGAFGGILGYGLSKMEGIGGLAGWSWIFIIEGLLTFVIGCISPWMLEDWPDRARFLTPLEREFVLTRLKDDTGLASQGDFNWKVVRRAAADWKTWTLMFMYIGVAAPLYGQSIFTPTIIAALGTWTRPQSLLLSTPPYVLAFIATMVTAWLSDKYQKRGIVLMFWSFIAIIGYVLLLTIPLKHSGALYFAVFVTIGAIAPALAGTIVWAGNTFGNHYKKATSMGMIFSLGNSGGIVASQIYRTNMAPRYLPAHGITLGFCAIAFITSFILYFGLRRENARRDAKYGFIDPLNSSIDGKGNGSKIVHDLDDEEYLNRWGLTGMTKEEIIDLGDDHPSYRFVL